MEPTPTMELPQELPLPVRGGMMPYLAGIGAILCWASLAATIGQSLHSLPPEAVLFYGLLIAGLALSAWEMIRHRRMTLPWPGAKAALFGVYGIWGYHTLLVMAFSLAPNVEANVLNYTWTLWIVLLGSLLPGHRWSLRILGAGLLGFAGVVAVLGGDAWWNGGSVGPGVGGAGLDGRALGLALALAAGVCWGSFTAFMRVVVPPRQGNMALFCLLAAGAAGVFMLARGVSPVLPLAHLWLVVYLGLVPLGLSFVLWEQAAKGCNVQVLGILSFFTPVLSTLLLALVSGESVSIWLVVGLAFILGGAALGSSLLRQTNRNGPAGQS